jgi:hypothetical protein
MTEQETLRLDNDTLLPVSMAEKTPIDAAAAAANADTLLITDDAEISQKVKRFR